MRLTAKRRRVYGERWDAIRWYGERRVYRLTDGPGDIFRGGSSVLQ